MFTRVVIDIETSSVIEKDYVYYDGPWELAKGDNSQAQMQISNQIAQQQLNMQQQVFGEVNPTIQSIISNQGLLPGQESALQSQLINSLPQTYNNLFGQLSQQLTARGLTGGQYGAGGGGVAAGYGSLMSSEAGQAQQGLFNIAQLKQQGLNSALGLGNANIGTLGNQGVQANSTAQSAAQAADQASTGFWGSLFGALGSAAGGAAKMGG